MARRKVTVYKGGSVMLPRTFAALLLLSVAPLTAGCERDTKTALSYTQDAKRAYDQALAEYESHNWIEAQAEFREVKRKYSYSRFARLAELKIADCDLELEKYAEAIKAFRAFVHDHPSDEEDISYARSRIVDAQYRQLSDSIVLPAGEERDQSVVLDAYKEMQSFLRDYPKSKEAPRVQKLVAEVTGRLIKHELYVARFYLQRNNFEAAVLRIEYAMRAYGPKRALDPLLDPSATAPTKSKSYQRAAIASGIEAEALLLLGETFLKMKKPEQARDAFQAVLDAYPESPLGVQAKNYLARMK